MKKLILILCLTLLLAGCDLLDKNGSSNIKEISASEVLKKIDREDNSFLLFYTTDKCYSCDEYEKVLEQVQLETPFDIYYINVENENEDKMEELKIKTGDYNTLPMTYYFSKGEVSSDNIKSGYIEPEQFKEWLRQLGIIK